MSRKIAVTFSQLNRYRLGNQLFQIAATIGIAKKNRCDFIFPTWRYSKYFQNPIPQQDEAVKGWPLREITHFHFKPILISDNTDLFGWFQSERYFKDCATAVRYHFQLKTEYSDYIEKHYRGVLSQPTCSIHVRRGDYLRMRSYHPVLPIAYYNRAMSYFEDGTIFVLCSDDIAWCKDNFPARNVVFIEGESDIIDLFIMSACKNHIIANSSFSWWSAWLNPHSKKRIVSPSARNWLGPGHSRWKTKDLIPAEWLQIYSPKQELRDCLSYLVGRVRAQVFQSSSRFRQR